MKLSSVNYMDILELTLFLFFLKHVFLFFFFVMYSNLPKLSKAIHYDLLFRFVIIQTAMTFLL